MSSWITRLKRYRIVLPSLAVGALTFAFLPLDGFRDVTQEMMALFGLLMAGILPTMAITAGALRPGNFSVKRLREYQTALRKQMLVWVGLFVISLVASVLVVAGKMLQWSYPVTIPAIEPLNLSEISFDGIRFVNAAIAAASTLTVARAFSLGNGLLSLLQLSTETAISEAVSRDEERHRAAEARIADLPERPGFGSYVDLPH